MKERLAVGERRERETEREREKGRERGREGEREGERVTLVIENPL